MAPTSNGNMPEYFVRKESSVESKCKALLPNLPSEDGWKNCRLYEYKGFWFLPHHICAYINFYNNFQARDEDCILVTPPKAGTTWIKALVFAVSHDTGRVTPTTLSSTTTPKSWCKCLRCNYMPMGESLTCTRVMGHACLGLMCRTHGCRTQSPNLHVVRWCSCGGIPRTTWRRCVSSQC